MKRLALRCRFAMRCTSAQKSICVHQHYQCQPQYHFSSTSNPLQPSPEEFRMLSMAVKSYKAGGVLRANKKVPNPTPVQDAYEDIKIYGGTVDSQKALLQCVKYTRVRRIFTLYCLKMERQPILCTTLSDVLAQNPPDFPFLDDIKAISDATGYFFEYLKANGADSELGRAEASHQLPEFLLASLLMMKYLGVSAPLIAREMHICRYLPLDLFVEFWRDALHLGLTTPNQVHLYLIGPLFKRSLYNQKIQKTTRNFVKMLKIKDKSIRVEMNKLLGKVDLSDVEATFNYLLKIGYTSEQISQVPHLCAFKTEQISNLVRSPPADLRPYMENAKDNITKLKLIFVYLDRENGFELSNTTPRTKTS